jgi:Mg-chelatase subunit ChlD
MNLRPRASFGCLGLAALLALGCSEKPTGESTGEISLRVSQTGGNTEAGVATSVSISNKQGDPIPLEQVHPHFIVEASTNGGPWVALPNVEANFQGPHRLDVIVVADNSGSEAGMLDTMREAMTDFAHLTLTRAAPDRMGLVRVSTEAQVYQDLTEDSDVFAGTLDRLFVTNGWTALWDGVRQANEVLAASELPLESAGNVNGFCADRTHRAIVAFTDGRENNSADEHETIYAGDGIDTTFEDLLKLQVDGIKTPVHWVEVGDQADSDALEVMADATGARHVAVEKMGQLHGALTSTAARLTSEVPICFELTSCGSVDLRMTVQFELDGVPQSVSVPNWMHATCTCSGKGKPRCELTETANGN